MMHVDLLQIVPLCFIHNLIRKKLIYTTEKNY